MSNVDEITRNKVAGRRLYLALKLKGLALTDKSLFDDIHWEKLRLPRTARTLKFWFDEGVPYYSKGIKIYPIALISEYFNIKQEYFCDEVIITDEEFKDLIISVPTMSQSDDERKCGNIIDESPPVDKRLGFFRRTADCVGKEILKKEFKYLSGHYFEYSYWRREDFPQDTYILRGLIEVIEYDEENNILIAIHKTDRGRYDGFILLADNRLFWFFECVEGESFPEITIYNTYKSTSSNYSFISGIILAGTRGGVSMAPSVPCAARVVFRKIDSKEAEEGKLGFHSKEELVNIDAQHKAILKYLDYDAENNKGLLLPMYGFGANSI